MKVLVVVGVMFETMICGLFPAFSVKSKISTEVKEVILGISNAFAGGIFLSAGFLHLLAEAIETLEHTWEHSHYPFALLFCSIGFLLVFFFGESCYWRTPS